MKPYGADMPDKDHRATAAAVQPGDRVKALRQALSLTQGNLAAAAGFKGYLDVLRIEKGKNQLRLYSWRDGLAAGFKLTLEEFSAYLAGDLLLEAAATLYRVRAGEAVSPARTSAA
jgi:transcriptional regulator with XRE-family HTH domain